jgi:ssDNA-binding replication factor A large subunit
MAEGTVGDETGSAEFRFVGDWIDKLSEGRVIAIRNGRANVIKEYLRLEIDIFGKVSVEPVTFTFFWESFLLTGKGLSN